MKKGMGGDHARRPGPAPACAAGPDRAARFLDNQRAFDSVAADYDGPLGNNSLVQRMRSALWRSVVDCVPTGGRLLDLGCGTGLDAEYLARQGYRVVAVDWSPAMIERAQSRVARAGLAERISVKALGIHELDQLGSGKFDCLYSNLGALNCLMDVPAFAESCGELLVPGGKVVVSVIGRRCPWETLYYVTRGNLKRAGLRYARGMVPVPLNQHTVWTAYYAPKEFYAAFEDVAELTSYRGLGLFLPPPYLVQWCRRWPRLSASLAWLDDRFGALPVLRDAGDHFLMILTKRA